MDRRTFLQFCGAVSFTGFHNQLFGDEAFDVVADDAHQRRMLEQLRDVIIWRRNNPDKQDVRLMVSETGVPTIGEDVEKWAALLEKFYEVANHYNLDVFHWAAGAWWDVDKGENGSPERREYCCNITRRDWEREHQEFMAALESQGRELEELTETEVQQLKQLQEKHWLVSEDPVTNVIRDNPTTHRYARGVALAGGEFSLGNEIHVLDGGALVGSIDTWNYLYHTNDGRQIWQLLADAGVEWIRFAFRLEALFDVYTGAFNDVDKAHFEGAIALARRAGLKIMLDPHNYGAISVDGKGHALGGDVFSTDLYAQMLKNLGALAIEHADVIQFVSIMTEPVNVRSASDWERYSQEAVVTLRDSGYEGWIKVPTAGWQGVNSAPGYHPQGFWIDDPFGRTAVGVHFYHDLDQSGTYKTSYTEDEVVLIAQGFGAGVVSFPL